MSLCTCTNKIDLKIKESPCQVFFVNFKKDFTDINQTCYTVDNQVINNSTIFSVSAETKTGCLPDSGVTIVLERFNAEGNFISKSQFVQKPSYNLLKVYKNRVETSFCVTFVGTEYLKVSMFVDNKDRTSNTVSLTLKRPEGAY